MTWSVCSFIHQVLSPFFEALDRMLLFPLTLMAICVEMKNGSRAKWPVPLSWQLYIKGIVSLAHFWCICLSLSAALFLTPTLMRNHSQNWAVAIRHTPARYCNWGCLCKKRANLNSGAHGPLSIPRATHDLEQEGGGRRMVSLTGCFFRVVTHEALPRSCCFAEAKHVKEPHFFQMELYLVQILFQEHKAQGA